MFYLYVDLRVRSQRNVLYAVIASPAAAESAFRTAITHVHNSPDIIKSVLSAHHVKMR